MSRAQLSWFIQCLRKMCNFIIFGKFKEITLLVVVVVVVVVVGSVILFILAKISYSFFIQDFFILVLFLYNIIYFLLFFITHFVGILSYFLLSPRGNLTLLHL